MLFVWIIRVIIKWVIFLSIPIILFGIACFYWIDNSNNDFLYDKASEIPECKTALILGTSAYLQNGNQNLYFSYRINAALELFGSGKIKKFIVSGDNRVNDYNEPKEMKKALIARGIPDSCIVMDYAGLRTFDSMVRCKEIFGQDSTIVISQRFHNARALFIADKIGLKAFGYNAKEVTSQNPFKVKFREFFSRMKCVLDLYLLNTKPRHLGEKILIN